MSKWGFDKIAARLPRVSKQFLHEGMDLAQKEFRANFDGQRNSESGVGWDMVKRGVPPPILDVSGRLKKHTLDKRNVKFFAVTAVLTIDPIDKNGRGYASYHMKGTDRMVRREFVTQSSSLDRKQLIALINATKRAFG